MSPFWRWDNANRRPKSGSIRAGDIIGVVGSRVDRGIQWTLLSSKPDWAKDISHVGIACDHRTVVHAMPRKAQSGGEVVQIELFPEMVVLGMFFVVLRQANGTSGLAVADAAKQFLKTAYSISQTVRNYMKSAPQSPLYRAIQSDPNAVRALPNAVTCSTLVEETFALAMSINTPFAVMRKAMFVPLPVEIVTCPGFDIILPSWG